MPLSNNASLSLSDAHTHTHTHTHELSYIVACPDTQHTTLPLSLTRKHIVCAHTHTRPHTQHGLHAPSKTHELTQTCLPTPHHVYPAAAAELLWMTVKRHRN